jgi:uncharacterized membrane protein
MLRIFKKRIGIGLPVFLGLLLSSAALFSIETRGPRLIPVSDGDAINISTHAIDPGEVKFYSYRDRAGAEIRFVLARDANGTVRAAMDACQRCYTYHQGYVSSDGYLVCKLCGNRYKLHVMTSGLASCVPVKLSLKMTGRTARISTAELERNRGLF